MLTVFHMIVSFYVGTQNAGEFQLLHIFTNARYCHSFDGHLHILFGEVPVQIFHLSSY